MKSSQLFLNFGKAIIRHLNIVPARPPAAGSKTKAPADQSSDASLEEYCHRLLARAGCTSLRIRVVWNKRLKTTAGSACWRHKRLSLNPRLQKISQDEVHRTLLHELAHFLAQFRAGKRRIAPHGTEWKIACADLGIPEEPRCHNLPFARNRREPRFYYVCSHCGQSMTRVRAPKGPVACLACCKKYNRGRYHQRFRFVQVPSPRDAAA